MEDSFTPKAFWKLKRLIFLKEDNKHNQSTCRLPSKI